MKRLTMILIKTDNFEDIKPYENTSVTAKGTGRKQTAKFIIDIDDYNYKEVFEYARNCNHIIHANYIGSDELLQTIQIPDGLYVTKTYTLVDINDSTEITNFVNTIPQGITPVIRIPEQYKDLDILMMWVYYTCANYPTIRVVGGNFFALEGTRVGYIGRDMYETDDSSKYEYNEYCFDILAKTDVEIFAGVVKGKKKSNGSSENKKKQVQKSEKRGKYADLLDLRGNL